MTDVEKKDYYRLVWRVDTKTVDSSKNPYQDGID